MIGTRTTANVLLGSLGLLALFHILVLLRVLPPRIVWGGRSGGAGARLGVLETVALLVTILFAGIIAAKARYLGSGWPGRAVSVAMWCVFGYFAINVVANVASSSTLERAIFTPVSVILAALALRLAMSK